MEESSEHFLSEEDIQKGISDGILKYEGKNFLEKFAIYLGMAQILEFGLKKLLEEKFQYEPEKLERWSLGMVAKELEKNNLREDFIVLLKSVVEYRNYIAHDMLANRALIHNILGNQATEVHYDKDQRTLDKSIIELEQLIFLFDWTNEHDGWE
jgi:hypothetical protein